MGNILEKKQKPQVKNIKVVLKNELQNKTTDEILDEIIARYMADDKINNPAIPDWIESKMYKNILKMTIGILSDTVNNLEIEVLGHIITMNIRPKI